MRKSIGSTFYLTFNQSKFVLASLVHLSVLEEIRTKWDANVESGSRLLCAPLAKMGDAEMLRDWGRGSKCGAHRLRGWMQFGVVSVVVGPNSDGHSNIILEFTALMILASNIVCNETTKLVLDPISIQRLIWYWAQFNSKTHNINIQTKSNINLANFQSYLLILLNQLHIKNQPKYPILNSKDQSQFHKKIQKKNTNQGPYTILLSTYGLISWGCHRQRDAIVVCGITIV
jgi:hypothetical protein